MAEPFIKLYKKMLDWEWYDDTNTKILFLHCLLKANWKSTRWHGIDIEPGQFITSLQTLADETHLSVRQVRVALDHLIMTGELTNKSHSKFRVITVNAWSDYQGNDKQSVKELTNRRQTSDKQVTTVKEYKELEEYKEIKNKFIAPTVEEVKAYCQERNNNVDPVTFVNFYSSKGWMVGKNKMKDWKACVRTWERSENRTTKPTVNTKIHNYDERDYDFDELMKGIVT